MASWDNYGGWSNEKISYKAFFFYKLVKEYETQEKTKHTDKSE